MPDRTPFQHDHYVFREKVFRFFGGEFDIYDCYGKLALHSEQKSFKLREDMRLYSDKSQTIELLSIRTGQILDIGATYEATDSRTAQTFGFLPRNGLKSIWSGMNGFSAIRINRKLP